MLNKSFSSVLSRRSVCSSSTSSLFSIPSRHHAHSASTTPNTPISTSSPLPSSHNILSNQSSMNHTPQTQFHSTLSTTPFQQQNISLPRHHHHNYPHSNSIFPYLSTPQLHHPLPHPLQTQSHSIQNTLPSTTPSNLPSPSFHSLLNTFHQLKTQIQQLTRQLQHHFQHFSELVKLQNSPQNRKTRKHLQKALKSSQKQLGKNKTGKGQFPPSNFVYPFTLLAAVPTTVSLADDFTMHAATNVVHGLTSGTEKSLDDFYEATQILQLAQMQRRALLEEQMMNEVRQNMSYQEQKEYEYRVQLHRNRYGDGAPLPYELLDEADQMKSQSDPLYMASQILSPEEAQKLHKWYYSSAVNSAVVQFLTDDVANYLRSFCFDDFFQVLDIWAEYLPFLIPHYFITPYVCNFTWNLIPSMPAELKLLYPSTLLRPLYWVGSFFNSGNILVDLRCVMNCSIALYATSTWCGVQLVDSFPQFYKYFGYYCLYPFAWMLYRFGDRYLLTHIIQASMTVDDRRRELDYQKRFNPSPSFRERVRYAIDSMFPMTVAPVHDTTGHYDDSPSTLYQPPNYSQHPISAPKPLF